MTTLELMSRLNYLLGRFEAASWCVENASIKNTLQDTCEGLQELIDELQPKETVSANDVMDGKKAYDTNGCVTTGRSDACVTCDFYDSESDYCTLCRNSVLSKKNITIPNTATVTNDPHRVTTAYNHDNDWDLLKKEFGIDTMCEVKP